MNRLDGSRNRLGDEVALMQVPLVLAVDASPVLWDDSTAAYSGRCVAGQSAGILPDRFRPIHHSGHSDENPLPLQYDSGSVRR